MFKLICSVNAGSNVRCSDGCNDMVSQSQAIYYTIHDYNVKTQLVKHAYLLFLDTHLKCFLSTYVDTVCVYLYTVFVI